MKKLAIGCGVVLLLIGITAAGVAYYVYRQVSSTVAQFAEFGYLRHVARANDDVNIGIHLPREPNGVA
mgnify:CR=1 FL=1